MVLHGIYSVIYILCISDGFIYYLEWWNRDK